MIPARGSRARAPAALRRRDGSVVLHQHVRAAQRRIHLAVPLGGFATEIWRCFLKGCLQGGALQVMTLCKTPHEYEFCESKTQATRKS